MHCLNLNESNLYYHNFEHPGRLFPHQFKSQQLAE